MDGKPYQCPECPETFALISQFKNHLLSAHDDTKELRCSDCFKLFADAQELLSHRNKEHRLECEICNKSFSKLGFLQAHVEVHNGPSLFNCRYCNAGFDNEFSFRQHSKTHPKYKRLRKTHPCPTCGESFIDSHQLMDHYQTEGHKQKATTITVSLPLVSPIVSIDESHTSFDSAHGTTPLLDEDTSMIVNN